MGRTASTRRRHKNATWWTGQRNGCRKGFASCTSCCAGRISWSSTRSRRPRWSHDGSSTRHDATTRYAAARYATSSWYAYGTTWYATASTRYATASTRYAHGATRHGTTWHGTTWHGTTWHGTAWHGTT